MRTRSIIGIAAALVVSLQATAQEYDDMYFRSKDREKIKSQTPESYSSNYENFKKKHFPEAAEQDQAMNPTDSYSARQINPEYVSRSNSEQASEEQNYFIEGYRPADTTVNSDQLYGQPYYSSGYYGSSSYGSMYSPYYGYCDPWMSPYYGGYSNTGWSSAFNYYGGPWGSGWNMNFGYGWGNTCNNYSPYGYGGYGGYGYYPGTVIVVSEGSRPNYGKRPSRNSALVGDVRRHYSVNSSNGNSTINGNGSSNGRSRDEYYVRPGRRISSNDNNSSSNTNSNTYGTSRPRSYSNSSATNNSGTSQNRSSNLYRESRSSTFSSPSNNSFNSGGSRSRSSSSGSSGTSGSRSRGRD